MFSEVQFGGLPVITVYPVHINFTVIIIIEIVIVITLHVKVKQYGVACVVDKTSIEVRRLLRDDSEGRINDVVSV